jgi:hypothetical protein
MQKMARETLLDPAVKEYYLAGREFDLAADVVMDPQYLELFVHCHPDHGIGHFAVHACMRNLWTVNGEQLDKKNLRLEDCIKVLKEEHEQGWLGVHEFTGLREEFRRNAAYEHVLAYQRKEIDGVELTEAMCKVGIPLDGGNPATWRPKFILPGLDLKVPIFTHFVEGTTAPQPGRILYQDEDIIVFPNNRGASIAQEGHFKAAMSEIHLIAVPKQRIFDAVTLTPQHIDLLQETMLKVKDLFQQDHFKTYLLEEQDQWFINEVIAPENVDFFVQPYPLASTGHFCIHCVAEKLRTKGVLQQKHKNLPLQSVIKALKAEVMHSNLGMEDYVKMRQDFETLDGGAVADTVREWERGEITGAEAAAVAPILKGMHLPVAKFEQPIFTMFVEAELGPKPAVVFYEDDEMMIFPNVKEHTRQLQKAKDKTGEGESAAMSYVHMLAIPKKRIYNAVLLMRKDVPLMRRMMEKAKETLQRPETVDYYLRQRDLDLSTEVFDVRQLEFFVHCHPHQSVGHLHIHCCLRNLWTKNGTILAQKNVLMRHVLEVVNGVSISRRLSQDATSMGISHEAAAGAPITQLALAKMKDAEDAAKRWGQARKLSRDGKKSACRLTMARYRSSSSGVIPPALAVKSENRYYYSTTICTFLLQYHCNATVQRLFSLLPL